MKLFNIFKKKKNVSNVVKKEFAYSKITIFEEWLDDILKDELPSEVKAISFVIYEDIDNKWSIELGGAKNYDKNNDDWPCDFNLVYITRNNTFDKISLLLILT